MAALTNANSGQIAAANTSQQVSAANASQTYWAVHNPGTSFDLWLGIGAAAVPGAGSIRIPPGKTYDSAAVPQLTQAALYLFCTAPYAAFTVLNVA